jgi:hypothetical protein
VEDRLVFPTADKVHSAVSPPRLRWVKMPFA